MYFPIFVIYQAHDAIYADVHDIKVFSIFYPRAMHSMHLYYPFHYHKTHMIRPYMILEHHRTKVVHRQASRRGALDINRLFIKYIMF